MRTLALAILLAGCSHDMGTSTPPPYGMDLRIAISSSLPALADLAISSLHLHLTQIAAVSDRSSNDPRARKDFADIDFGMSVDVPMPSAPPGTYSAVAWSLGDAMQSGIDLQGVVGKQPIHVQLDGGSYDARCVSPLPLAPGQRVRLTLSADATHWFDGVDLSGVQMDEDDKGIIITMEDNAPLAFEILNNAIKSFQVECEAW